MNKNKSEHELFKINEVKDHKSRENSSSLSENNINHGHMGLGKKYIDTDDRKIEFDEGDEDEFSNNSDKSKDKEMIIN